jgi:hypothetical protein
VHPGFTVSGQVSGKITSPERMELLAGALREVVAIFTLKARSALKNGLPLHDLHVCSRQLRAWSQSGWGPTRATSSLPRCKKDCPQGPDMQPQPR